MALPTRWRSTVAATAVLAGVGVTAGSATLLLAAVIPLCYIVYSAASTARLPDDLAVERHIEPATAPPGTPVSVSLTVRNDGDLTLPDLRVVDAVPDELAVLEGSPRGVDTLGPGEAMAVEYVVVAKRGEYDFAPPRLRLRTVAAGSVTTADRTPAGDASLVCRLDADAPPLDEHGKRYVGQLASDRPGPGVQFHSTREYRREDPADRIDWRHYAKRGELATVNYQERRAATVVLVVDARPAARVVASPGRPTAIELSAYAATRALTDLLRAGHEVAVATIGTDGAGPAGIEWLPAGGGPTHREAAITVFEAATEADAEGMDMRAQLDRIAALSPPGSQMVLFSPLLDDGAVDAVTTWGGYDVPRTVLSPDVLTTNTVSGQCEATERRTRLAQCQASGARTVDWRRGTPLPLALEYAFAAAKRAGGPNVATARGGR